MEKAKTVRDEMITTQNAETELILKTKRPNILLIILESFNNKIISELGGMPQVTPNLNRYCKEGICFTNFYSNGDRSDKGLVAIHSGFPAQAIASIIKFPYKTETLPFFTKDLKKHGYNCSYYYGGDINFAAMRSYINNAGYDKITTDTDFPKSTYGAKWGVHDEYVFEKYIQDIPNAKKPFLHTIFTLSSHEPFDVPFKSEFNGNTKEQRFLNAAKYTDSCLGVFIEKLRKLPEWDSTLVIITADHGSNHPNNTDYYECIRYKIPMVWLGGALKQNPLKITHTGAQSDIPVTLLKQLGIEPEKKFMYSKDLFNESSKSYAYYSFNNGFGLVTETAKIVFNNSSKTILFKEGNTDTLLYLGKCIQQVVYDEFLNR
jgi:phosphoglycerol transferase MdoB-like AlkP superfamily enzyme